MVKFIDIYSQTFVTNEVQADYSRTARAVTAKKAEAFDEILAQENAAYARTPTMPDSQDKHFAETEQIFLRAKSLSGPDPIFSDGAQRKYQELHELFSHYDPVLTAHRYSRNGDIA